MSQIVFINESQARVIHQQQLALFGGASGILDERKLSSALARARNIYSFNLDASLYDLAAALGWGVAKNHPFVDGNKRTAFVIMAVFLQVNGIKLMASEVDVVNTMLGVASGEISEKQLKVWLQKNC